ncbi:MAG: M24 family metallopeptidase [Pseudomonadota bacterium]
MKTIPVAGLAATAACSHSASGESAGEKSAAGSNIEMPAGTGGDLEFSKEEYARRYDGVRAGMVEAELDALIVTGCREWYLGDLANLKYLGVPLDWTRTYMVLPLDRDPVVFNRIPGFPIFKELSPGGPPPMPQGKPPVVNFEKAFSKPRPGSRFSGDHAPSIAKALSDMGLSSGRIGIVSMRVVPADVVLALQSALPNATFVDAESILVKMRYYKSAEEQQFLRRSGYIADVGFAAAVEASRVGATDLDVFYAADIACAKAGAPAGGFQLVGTGKWGGKKSDVLIAPGKQTALETGHVMVPEIGSDYHGYYTQLSAPISLGEPSDEFYQAMELCDKVYAFNLTQMVAGKTVWEVDQACHEFTKDASNGAFGTVFGIQAGEHERTFFHDDYELKPGAMAYNQPFFLPMQKPGGPFHVYGDALLITDGAPERLHQTPMELVIV